MVREQAWMSASDGITGTSTASASRTMLVEIVRLQRRGRIDDDPVGAMRHAQLEAPRHAERARIGGDSEDRRLVRRALFEPARG
jgi:hypothetical protein